MIGQSYVPRWNDHPDRVKNKGPGALSDDRWRGDRGDSTYCNPSAKRRHLSHTENFGDKIPEFLCRADENTRLELVAPRSIWWVCIHLSPRDFGPTIRRG